MEHVEERKHVMDELNYIIMMKLYDSFVFTVDCRSHCRAEEQMMLGNVGRSYHYGRRKWEAVLFCYQIKEVIPSF